MSTEKMNTENTTVTPQRKFMEHRRKKHAETAAAAPATHNTHAAPAPPLPQLMSTRKPKRWTPHLT